MLKNVKNMYLVFCHHSSSLNLLAHFPRRKIFIRSFILVSRRRGIDGDRGDRYEKSKKIKKMKDLLDLLYSKKCKLLMTAVLNCTPPVENVEHLNSQRTWHLFSRLILHDTAGICTSYKVKVQGAINQCC